MCMYLSLSLYIYICMYIHTCIYTRTYTYVYIYIYIYTLYIQIVKRRVPGDAARRGLGARGAGGCGVHHND